MAYKFLQIKDFAKAGLNSDLMPWDLPGSFLTEVSNIRVKNDSLTPFGGNALYVDLPVDFFPGFILGTNSSIKFWLIAGRDAVYAYDGSTLSDISSAIGYAGISSEELWQGCLLASIPILNNPNHYPEYWSPQNGAQILRPLPWDASNTWQDVGETAKVIRSHKQYLFALGLESVALGEVPDGVRWSAPADINGLPPTWDHLDTTQVAGFTTLGGGGGSIVDGLGLRDAFVVYRESGIDVFDFVGGQFIWSIRSLSNTVGLVAPDAIAEVKGKHFFIGDGDILMNDGNQIQSMLHNRIRSRFVSNFDADNFSRSYAVRHSNASEVWFFVPEAGHDFPNLIYMYNWRDDTWSIRDAPEAPMSAYGAQSTPPITWGSIGGTWDNVLGKWSQSQISPLDDSLITCIQPEGAGLSGSLKHLSLTTGAVISSFSSVIERTGFALEGLGKVNTITRIYPHVSGEGPIQIEVGSQDYPGAPTRWKAPVSFNPSTDRKVDVRTTGELHCFRISTQDSDTIWRISGIDIEYVDAGLR